MSGNRSIRKGDSKLYETDPETISGKDKEDHDQNLRAVMDRIPKSGLKLNKSKCAFGLNQLKYCGHIFSNKGVKADP